ncbi:RNase adapter RapZ [Thermotoga sp. 38H-to]|uniref:RNase adapter RapZ n=1 Tax=Thermotoga sp. 38H-to TaxID=1755812 RepID=UPI0013EA9488|nr:RNase adapter RapZ [Thermotoga sp. 38H-to]KAF2960630.1 nucleotide-binding protein [Thermotoga sp. 38H-to]
MKRIVVVSGLSGAGKTSAMGFLEDLGYFCVDNVPGNILEELLKLFMSSDLEKMAMAIDVRSEHLGDPISTVERIKEKTNALVIFLEASTEELLRRYALTRRRHPLQKDGVGLEDAIEKERKILSRIREIADVVIDTTSMNTHQLRETLTHFLVNQAGGTSVRIMSFGFKHGIPMDVDFVFDARFLPNPHYVPELSSKTGLDSEVEAYFKNYPVVEEFIEKIYEVLKVAIEEYQRTGRRIITVGIGCTGGKHRSVYIAHRLKEMLEKEGFTVIEKHRDREKV